MEMTKERAIKTLRESNVKLLNHIQSLMNTAKKSKPGKYYDVIEYCIEEYRAVELAIIALIALPSTEKPVTKEEVFITVNVTTERG